VQVALAERQQTKRAKGNDEIARVIDRLGNPQSFFPDGIARGERAQLGMAFGKPGTQAHSREEDLTAALVTSPPVEERHGRLEAVDGPMIVALELVGFAEVAVRQGLQDELPAVRSERQGALGSGNGLVMRAYEEEMD
jgi:hypothetical protein